MRRRDILRKCVAVGAVGGVGSLAGCTGGGESETEESSLRVESFDYREGDSGTLVVSVTVKNSGKAEGTGHLYVTVTAAEPTSETEGDDSGTVTTRESAEVTVPAGETRTVAVSFDVTHDQFVRNGSINVDLRS